MKRLLQLLTKRWVISIIGIAALIVIIWLGGPLLGGEDSPLASPFNQLLATLFVVVLWGLNNLRLRIKAGQNNAQMIEQITAAPVTPEEETPDVSAEEVAVLKERFEHALARLKSMNFGGRFGRQYLYELPWYVIIGPPGSGKTTLLENSGLEFPLADTDTDKKVDGVGGTRNCDWWFTNEAVLLDTAGRYTTQDSFAEADSGAWLGFLDLIRQFRPRRPLNGILVAVSLAELLTHSEQEREAQAQAIRLRIQELYTRLGARLPVYVLFTKADLIAGFTEFFDDLNQEQRGQVWGYTLPADQEPAPGTLLQQFPNEFDALLRRLNGRLLWRLLNERDIKRRALILNFPHQVTNAKILFEDFLRKIFPVSRFEASAWARGVYLTSGTQQGSPIDRVMQTLANTFGVTRQSLPAFSGHPRSYFIQRLFRDVIFTETELGGTNLRYERRRLWLQRGAYAAAAGIAAATVFAWSVSFTRNQLLVNELDEQIIQYQQTAATLGSHLPLQEIATVLDKAKGINRVVDDDAQGAPWLMGMGLYQGFKLGSASEQAYQRILQQRLLPHIKARLERTITQTEDPEELRQVVNIYLMLGEPSILNEKQFRSWALRNWEPSLRDEPILRTHLTEHLDALLDSEFKPTALDQRLMANAQRVICDIPLSRQLYMALQQIAERKNMPSFSLQQLERRAQLVLTSSGAPNDRHEVPSFFTLSGYHEVVEKEGLDASKRTIKENFRVCEHKARTLKEADPQDVLQRMREHYFQDYVHQWESFLERIDLVTLRDVQHAAETVKILSEINSPLQQLLERVKKETTLESTHIGGVLERFDVDIDIAKPDDPVSQAFSALHDTLRGSDDTPPKIEDLLGQLNELYGYIAEIAETSDSHEAAYVKASARMAQNPTDVIRVLRNEANRLPAPLKRVITSTALQSWGTVLVATRQHINAVWRSTVLAEYRSSFENRYPLYRDKPEETTLADFGHFFGADGTLDSFMQTYLKPFVDFRRWRLRGLDQHNLGLSGDTLTQLRRAVEIKEMFFEDGGQTPLIRFQMTPLFLDDTVRRFTLDVSGETISYRHGPARTRKIDWPGTGQTDRVRIIFERLGASRFSIVKEGPWAWFHLLDESILDRTRSADKIVITFSTAGFNARYELRTSSVNNPFTNQALANFRCPERL